MSFIRLLFSSIICTIEMAWSAFHWHFKHSAQVYEILCGVFYFYLFLIFFSLSNGALYWPQKMQTLSFCLLCNRNALGVIETRTWEGNKCLCQVYVTYSELFLMEVRITIFIYIFNLLCLTYALMIPTNWFQHYYHCPFECVPTCGFDWRLYKPQNLNLPINLN